MYSCIYYKMLEVMPLGVKADGHESAVTQIEQQTRCPA
jgi:hypothetical protein